MLEFYESKLGFDCVELNFTFYTMPVAKTLESMAERTKASFLFVVRSHRLMTHEIWDDDSRSRLRDVTADFARFRQGIEPLIERRRLACVLVQLPTSFRRCAVNTDYLGRLPSLLPDTTVVVEFRNRSWLVEETFELLEKQGIGYCVVDEPQLGPLLPFVVRRTSAIAYFRLHGRNPAWFRAGRSERYNYSYTPAELGEFAAAVRSVSNNADRTLVFFNNCHAGAAARNALMMKQMLGLVSSLTLEQAQVVAGNDGATGQQLDLN